MKTISCCKPAAAPDAERAVPPLDARARTARAVAGVAMIAAAGVVYVWPLALLTRVGLPAIAAWVLAIPLLWLGVSHLVAAATAYRGCPELGAILSVLLRRRIETTCTPWERIDRRIGSAA